MECLPDQVKYFTQKMDEIDDNNHHEQLVGFIRGLPMLRGYARDSVGLNAPTLGEAAGSWEIRRAL